MLYYFIKLLLLEIVMYIVGFFVLYFCYGKKMLFKKIVIFFERFENDGEFFFIVIYMNKKFELLIEIMIDKIKVNF